MYDGNYFYIKYNNNESCSRCKNRYNGKSLRNKPLRIEIIEIDSENEMKEWIEITKNMNSLIKIDREVEKKKQAKKSSNEISYFQLPSSVPPPPSISSASIYSTPPPIPSSSTVLTPENSISETKVSSSSNTPQTASNHTIIKEKKWYIITEFKDENGYKVCIYIYALYKYIV